MEGKNKPINSLNTQTTYAELKKLFERVLAAAYWTETPKLPEPVAEVVEQTKVVEVAEETVQTKAGETTLCKAVDNMQMNEPQGQQLDSEQGSKMKYSNKY